MSWILGKLFYFTLYTWSLGMFLMASYLGIALLHSFYEEIKFQWVKWKRERNEQKNNR